jgi:hypothetical protein
MPTVNIGGFQETTTFLRNTESQSWKTEEEKICVFSILVKRLGINRGDVFDIRMDDKHHGNRQDLKFSHF